MLNVFTAIMDFLSMLGNYISNLVTGLFSMFELIGDSVTTISYAISYMPSVLGLFATAGIGICVVYHIIGR